METTSKKTSNKEVSGVGGTSYFDVIVTFSNIDDQSLPHFKVDGERFKSHTKTLKLNANARYRISVSVQPSTVQFFHLKIAGMDLALHTCDPSSGTYKTEWNTTGIQITRRGCRENIGLIFHGPNGVLSKVLQCKFYGPDDKHVRWGTTLTQLTLKCMTDGQGTMTVHSDEFR